MADLTTGRLALLRDRLAWDTEPHCLSTADFPLPPLRREQRRRGAAL